MDLGPISLEDGAETLRLALGQPDHIGVGQSRILRLSRGGHRILLVIYVLPSYVSLPMGQFAFTAAGDARRIRDRRTRPRLNMVKARER
ncbi:hypothetical protein GCM10022226_07560 [Sphaerisporangium flaviroseum]|uniref:Uncharacterized protein n=1 Tax=Sphaerisporangium flaviroseum TaxID=509199 RepID=A0ABP7HKF8_9ACTN